MSPFSATELGAAAIQGAVVRSGIPLELFSHVYMGHVLQAGTGQSPAKQAAIRAGLPETVEATTINKVCASGLKAITLAAQEIMLGHGAALVAGGMESMSNVPMYKRKRKNAMDPNSSDGEQGSDGMQDGLLNPYDGLLMGSCAEQLAVRYHVSRAEQDKCAIIAYRKASSACRKQAFLNEISPVPFSITKSGQVTSDVIRDKTLFQRLSALPPAFSDTGTITAGNSSTLADGASAVILANGVTARKYCQGASILAKIISFADASEVPSDFAVAPSKAVQIALDRAKLTIEDISLWEINEAFALVVLVNQEVWFYNYFPEPTGLLTYNYRF